MSRPQLPDFTRARILVAGDVMLDRYWFGDVSRISPEAPVPVVHVKRTEERPGGAANVARNITALDGAATLLAVAFGRRRRRPLLLALAAAELVPAVVDWRRLRPRLALPAFVAAWLMDDAAYQLGLLLGCLRQRSLAAFRVELRLIGGRRDRGERP